MPTKYIFCLILYVILSGEKRLRFAESKFHRAKSESPVLQTIIVRFREAKRLPYKGVEKVS